MLNEQTVVIIGGTSGMGWELARQVAAQGGHPVVVGRHRDKVERAVASLGAAASGYAAHIGDREALSRLFDQVGRLDHLVTTAAELVFKPFAAISPEEFLRAVQSKLIGPFQAAQLAAPRLTRTGSILFFSGLAAYRPSPGTAAVAAVNAALEGLAKALAVELAPLRVNVISPGVVDTPIWNHLASPERQSFYDHMARSLPVRRIGQATDLAQAALFALTNPFLSGTVLHVDGGGRLA